MDSNARFCIPMKESITQQLQQLVLESDGCLTDLASQIVVGCLAQESDGEGEETEAYGASVLEQDSQQVQALMRRVRGAFKDGLVWPMSEWDDPSIASKAEDGIFYLPSESSGYSAIVAGYDANVITTYGGDSHPSVLVSVDAYLKWRYDRYGEPYPYGLCVVPKGADPYEAADGEVCDASAPRLR